jgi:hypothetical protein
VRALPLACLALVLLSGVARADDTIDDEDGDFVPLPKRSIGIAFGGHGTRIHGVSESGVGPSLELALGNDRWQYVAEGGFATSNHTMPSTEAAIGGHVWRAAGGVRWLARQFRPDSHGGIELFVLSLAGVQRYHLDDGMRLTRAELALGFGMQARIYKKPRLTFRIDARVLLTPNDPTGFMSGVGFAW